MTRAAYVAAVLVLAVVVWLIATDSAADVPATTTPPEPPVTPPLVRTLQAAHTEQVHQLEHKLRIVRRRLSISKRRQGQLKRVLMSTPTVHEAIGLACTVYGSCTTLRRRAWCESQYDPRAHNSSGASGLFQFLGSTWRSTPFGSFSVWSPYANALAAGWMETRGRGGEWVCR